MAKRKRVEDSAAAEPEGFKVGDQVVYHRAQWEIVEASDGSRWVHIERMVPIRMLVPRDKVSRILLRKAEP